jgi:catechol 2,3-dioxygenase-like lactoylglutathione lyase family enzyme
VKGVAGNRGALFRCMEHENTAMSLTAQLTHFGVHTTDLDRMTDFYTRVMGFVISDTGIGGSGARVVFMTQNPECHHQFVLFDGRPGDMAYNPVNQISYRLDSLDTLKAYREKLIAEGITQHRVTDHGNAWALYFRDPEGNPVELYVDSPFYTPQPCGGPLDLDLPKPARTSCRARHGCRASGTSSTRGLEKNLCLQRSSKGSFTRSRCVVRPKRLCTSTISRTVQPIGSTGSSATRCLSRSKVM